MNKQFLSVLCLSLLLFSATAQTEIKQSSFRTVKKAVVSVNNLTEDYFPALQNVEAPNHGNKQTTKVQKIYKDAPQNKTSLKPPTVLRSYEGNGYNNRVPNDNDLAVSNSGHVVSVINSTINIYNDSTERLKNISLGAFAHELNILGSKFDPRVIYDQKEDRFIIIFLNGSTDSTSYIILAFSQTADPLGDWNLYALDGNPLKNNSWSDYPNVGISTHELFIGINTFLNKSQDASGFVESTLWQINKFDGYQGKDELRTIYYYDLGISSKTWYTIVPIQGGDELYGPNMYLMMNKNKAEDDDSLLLIEVSDTIGSPTKKLTTKYLATNLKYQKPFNASQPAHAELRTNDARIQNGYLHNGLLHFVFNCNNPKNNLASVYHGILDMETNQVKGYLLSHPFKEYGFPAIAYAGKNGTEDEAIIILNFSSDSIFPGNSVIYYAEGQHSEEKLIRQGGAELLAVGGSISRWGDYSGVQRKYNQPGIVWTSACFGKRQGLGTFANKVYGTWIGEIGNPKHYKNIVENSSIKNISLDVFPNPVSKQFQVAFKTQNHEEIYVYLIDLQGRKSAIYRSAIQPGSQLFTLSTHNLANGIYTLQIEGSKGLLINEKIVVSNP